MKSFKSMPKALQKEQRDLLGQINACPKCHTAWATCGSNLDNCPGATLSVPWRPLTTEMVDWAISAHKSTNRPILYNAILKQAASKTTVAVVHGALLDDISAYVNNVEHRAPVAAAIYGNLPVSHITRDAQVYGSFAGPALLSSRSSSRANVIAPVVGQHRLAHDDDDDEVDWSDGSASPSPKPIGVEVVGPREPSVEVCDDSAMPFELPHFVWNANLRGPASTVSHPLLIDDGCPFVLIRADVVIALALKERHLPKPQQMSVAMSEGSPQIFTASSYCKVGPEDPLGAWSSRSVRALVVPSLCFPMVLGIPFLAHNFLVTDYSSRTVIDKTSGFDLMNPSAPCPRPLCTSPVQRCCKIVATYEDTLELKKTVLIEFRGYVCDHPELLMSDPVHPIDVAAVVHARVEQLSEMERLTKLGADIKARFADVFGDIPHMEELPTDITCNISLKDANMTMQSRGYASPRKYREAWSVLIEKHLQAGCIRPSSSQFSSPAFLVPKSDPTALPRWVNNFRKLNVNTVPDRHPLPCIDSILSDCAKGNIWGKMDMTDSFFQSRMDPASVPLVSVQTPLGQYEWLVMPQGLRNAPAIQQCRVTQALREFIGRFCHIYLDDIIIWSKDEAEHAHHVELILEALQKARLFCNPKKCQFFQLEIDFLGHHISRCGVEAQQGKCEVIVNYPSPSSASEVRRFLGMVRFVAGYLENLAEYTHILTPLTKKECDKCFPGWTLEHKHAFINIKSLVLSRQCLTTIDHDNPGDNHIFLVTDASDWRHGAVRPGSK